MGDERINLGVFKVQEIKIFEWKTHWIVSLVLNKFSTSVCFVLKNNCFLKTDYIQSLVD